MSQFGKIPFPVSPLKLTHILNNPKTHKTTKILINFPVFFFRDKTKVKIRFNKFSHITSSKMMI